MSKRNLAVAIAAVAGLGLAASPAGATCSAPALSGPTATVTCSPGVGQTVNVPDHVNSVTLTVFGGDGGLTALVPFVGAGGGASATYTSPGPYALAVDVGTAGLDNGTAGTPGGGAGAGGGAGGGGLSQVTVGATPLIIAAGGAGAGTSNQFGKGGDGGGGTTSFGLDGQPGGICSTPTNCFSTALGGTQSAGGAGDGVPAGLNGSSGVGGDAATFGGGGGAGYFGGGGGGSPPAPVPGDITHGGGGGGGSTYVNPSLTGLTLPLGAGGDGLVQISYRNPGPAAITSAAATTFTIGSHVSFAIAASGGPVPAVSLDDPADLPAGLTFTPGAGGTAALAGTATGTARTVALTIRAQNGNGAPAVQTLTVTLVPAQAPVIPLPNGSIKSTGGGSVGVPLTAPGGGAPIAATSTGGVAVALGCNGDVTQTCTGKVSVTVRERTRGSKILAVLSRAKTKTKTVLVGSASYTIAAGKITVVKVTLNKTGKKLLTRFKKLKVKVKVAVSTASGQKQLASKTVTIKAPKAKKKK